LSFKLTASLQRAVNTCTVQNESAGTLKHLNMIPAVNWPNNYPRRLCNLFQVPDIGSWYGCCASWYGGSGKRWKLYRWAALQLRISQGGGAQQRRGNK
jgi:hypothetical protein